MEVYQEEIRSRMFELIINLILQVENIDVVSHPKKGLAHVWSHHQKTVVIDDKVAFLGGIGTFCFGQ